jgi:hypothetical protein
MPDIVMIGLQKFKAKKSVGQKINNFFSSKSKQKHVSGFATKWNEMMEDKLNSL